MRIVYIGKSENIEHNKPLTVLNETEKKFVIKDKNGEFITALKECCMIVVDEPVPRCHALEYLTCIDKQDISTKCADYAEEELFDGDTSNPFMAIPTIGPFGKNGTAMHYILTNDNEIRNTGYAKYPTSSNICLLYTPLMKCAHNLLISTDMFTGFENPDKADGMFPDPDIEVRKVKYIGDYVLTKDEIYDVVDADADTYVVEGPYGRLVRLQKFVFDEWKEEPEVQQEEAPVVESEEKPKPPTSGTSVQDNEHYAARILGSMPPAVIQGYSSDMITAALMVACEMLGV